MTSSTCNECLTRLLVIWPHRAPTSQDVAGLFQVYRSALDDLTDDEMRRATGQASKSCTYFPTPAELRVMARPATPVGEDCGPTVAGMLRIQERHKVFADEERRNALKELADPNAPPMLPEVQAAMEATPEERQAAVGRMIAEMQATMKARAVQASRTDYWQTKRGETLAERMKSINAYPMKDDADAIMDMLRDSGIEPPPGVNGLDKRIDFASRAAQLLKDRPERKPKGGPA
jgi:hypothetical protein